MSFGERPLLIGISARIYTPGTAGINVSGIWTKNLHYLEQSVAHWVLSGHAMAVMIPAVTKDSIVTRSDLDLDDYADTLDGLMLQGGNDVAPETYGEMPLHPEWAGDRVRDRYEIDLFNAFVAAGKPVIGICRGCQLINVALGGTLFQDIPTQVTQAISHRDADLYERALHDVTLIQGTKLSQMYPGVKQAKINSIHHQAVKDLGRDLVVEALGVPDGIVEAIRWRGASYVFGMQWHPEFLALKSLDTTQLDGSPILQDFLANARTARDA